MRGRPRRFDQRLAAEPCPRRIGLSRGDGSGIAQQENLGFAAALFSAVQAGREDSGVVEDQQIARIEQPGNLMEIHMVYQSRGSVEHQETRVITFCAGKLGNILLGQMVMIGLEF